MKRVTECSQRNKWFQVARIYIVMLMFHFAYTGDALAVTKLPKGDKILAVFDMLTTWILYLAPGSVALLATFHTFTGIWGQTDVLKQRAAKDKLASVVKWGTGVFVIGGIVKAIISAID